MQTHKHTFRCRIDVRSNHFWPFTRLRKPTASPVLLLLRLHLLHLKLLKFLLNQLRRFQIFRNTSICTTLFSYIHIRLFESYSKRRVSESAARRDLSSSSSSRRENVLTSFTCGTHFFQHSLVIELNKTCKLSDCTFASFTGSG